MVGAWFDGLGPRLLATVLGAVAAGYFFLASGGSFTGLGLSALPLALFAAQGGADQFVGSGTALRQGTCRGEYVGDP